MIDLHLHTTYSDGDGVISVEDLLKECEKLNFTAISITDHDNIGAYKELNIPNIRKIFSGKIIPGIELTGMFQGEPIHILGYNFDIKEMEKFLETLPKPITMQDVSFSVNNKLKELKIYQNINENITLENLEKELLNIIINNKDKLPNKINPLSIKSVWNEHLINKKSFFYLDLIDKHLKCEDIIDGIHKSNGKAILAHPYVYGENKDKIIESLIYKIDGIECYHYSVNDEQTRELLKLCISNNLIVTGGSDWHGKPNKRNPVNVQVPDNLINQF